MDLKDTYNKIAVDWNTDHKKDVWWNAGTVKFASYLKKGDKILDVGCAGGLKSEFLSKRGFDVTGIDLSDKMVEIAKQRVPGSNFFVADITKPLNLGQFDGVFAQAVLLHVPKKDIKSTFNNLLSVLKKGGYFYIAVKQLRPGEKEEQVIKENDYGYEYERFFSFFTHPELKKDLEEFNLKIIYSDITSYNDTVWIQIISQKNG